jgi:virginiamycin B lyase
LEVWTGRYRLDPGKSQERGVALTQQHSKWARPSPTVRVVVLGLLAAMLLVLPLVLAPRADAYVYWAKGTVGHSIGRANLNGTGVEQGFIREQRQLFDLAVNDRHIYWSRYGDSIGRAKLDGTGVVPDFFRAPGATSCFRGCAPVSLAVDSDHIYWTTLRGSPPIGGIGRARLDGTGAEADFISGISLDSLAIDRDHIYWTDSPGTIGRANLDGTAVDASFITGLHSVLDVAVGHDHIYWTRQPTQGKGTIGRARIDGTGANESFITGVGRPSGVAVDAKHVYWTLDKTLGRAKLDGTDVNQRFIDPIREGYLAIAVDGLGPPGRATAKPTQGQKGKKIVLRVKVKARKRLTARASGEIKVNPTYKLKPKKTEVAAGKTKKLRLKPKKKAARKIAQALKRGEKAKAKLTVKLTDRAGNSETEKLRVTLQR